MRVLRSCRHIFVGLLVVAVMGPATVRACFADAAWREMHQRATTPAVKMAHACCAARQATLPTHISAPCDRCFETTILRDQAGRRSSMPPVALAIGCVDLPSTVTGVCPFTMSHHAAGIGILAPPVDPVRCHVLLTV